MIEWGVDYGICAGLDRRESRNHRRETASHHLRASASDRDGSKNLHLERNARQEVKSRTRLEESLQVAYRQKTAAGRCARRLVRSEFVLSVHRLPLLDCNEPPYGIPHLGLILVKSERSSRVPVIDHTLFRSLRRVFSYPRVIDFNAVVEDCCSTFPVGYFVTLIQSLLKEGCEVIPTHPRSPSKSMHNSPLLSPIDSVLRASCRGTERRFCSFAW